MSAPVNRTEIENIEDLFTTLLDWSGVDGDTPDDTELVYINGKTILYGDVKEAAATLARVKESLSGRP